MLHHANRPTYWNDIWDLSDMNTDTTQTVDPFNYGWMISEGSTGPSCLPTKESRWIASAMGLIVAANKACQRDHERPELVMMQVTA